MKEYDQSSWEKWSPVGGKITETTNGIEIGSLVSISDNASFWNGEKVEKWYRGRKWYVTGLNGNKADLGKDETGKYKIRLPISTNFLTKVE
jgi:hypothetical protein